MEEHERETDPLTSDRWHRSCTERPMRIAAMTLWSIAACAPTPDRVDLSSDVSTLESVAAAAELAENRLEVPADLLLAIAWFETELGASRSRSHAETDGLHVPPTIGVGAIRSWSDPALLEEAELRLGVDRAAIDRDPRLGLLATASLLRDLMERRGDAPSNEPGAWFEALGDYAELHDADARARYANDVLDVLRRGFEAEVDGVAIAVARRAVEVPDRVRPARLAHHPEYPGAIWTPARAGHFEVGRDGSEITHIIIHTMQGTYAGSISWFQSPSNPYLTSTQYLIRSSDGEITQMVHEADTAHHIGGWNPFTIGIEHEGYIDNPDRWYTEAMYRSSARLVGHLCAKYDIPIDREHIVGHVEVPGASHTDPGPGWDWDRYMGYVREASAPRLAASLVGVDHPVELVSGSTAAVRFDFRNEGTATWSLESTRLVVASERASELYHDADWEDPLRVTAPDAPAASDTIGRFAFVVRAPDVAEPIDVVETFQLRDGDESFGPLVDIAIRVVPVVAEVDAGPLVSDAGAAAADAGAAAAEGSVTGGCTCSTADTTCAIGPFFFIGWLALRRRFIV